MRSIPTTSIFEASGNMLAGGTGEVFLSSDAGRSWNNYPLSPSSTATFSAFAETQDGTIYAATSHGIFYSTNHGYQWDSLHTGLVKTPFYSIAIAKNGNIFAGSTKTIYRSTDNGSSWKNLNISIPSNGGKITTLLAATGGGLMAGTDSSGVYYSTDNGDSWESNSLGISGSKINTLLEVPDKRIFAATSEGVFYIESIDAAFWWPYNDGLPIKDVNAICLGADGHLYVGAQRSGVLRSTEIFSHQSGVKLTGNLSPETLLGTNYPNPFSASTTIPFSLAERSFITIEVLDALGRSVAEVASGVYEAGKYETKFDAGNLAAGTYFIRLKTENKSYFSACVVSK
jgi:photosystem II stability/assembly factor-like uncharacterized protein